MPCSSFRSLPYKPPSTIQSFLLWSHFKKDPPTTGHQIKNESWKWKCNVWLQNLVMWFCIGGKLLHTSYNSFNKRTKVLSLQITIFDLKMMVNNGLEFFILKFTEVWAPSEVAAQLPGQFSHAGRMFLHWAVVTLKGPQCLICYIKAHIAGKPQITSI